MQLDIIRRSHRILKGTTSLNDTLMMLPGLMILGPDLILLIETWMFSSFLKVLGIYANAVYHGGRSHINLQYVPTLLLLRTVLSIFF